MCAWIDARQVAALAAKEFRDRMRNRWVLAVAAVFTALSVAIGYFGGAEQGVLGPRSLEFVITSLASLVIYLVPMIALLLGFDAVVGERERGSLDLLLSLPLTRGEVLLGKYLGLAAALVLATAGGFALLAVLLAQQFGRPGLYHYLGFVASAALLGLAFLSLALWLSVLSRDRAQASGLAIGLWFFFVLVFDLLLLGLLVAGAGEGAGEG
ncbi:ABC transporter permease, partial [Cupriavidus necator]|uniref:ABC transporter permease n=1 Tax=Cupriavidus necator TaxID=106590 RepID=UPI00339D3952